MAVAESAGQADTQSVCITHATIGQYFNWYRRSLGHSWASCLLYFYTYIFCELLYVLFFECL